MFCSWFLCNNSTAGFVPFLVLIKLKLVILQQLSSSKSSWCHDRNRCHLKDTCHIVQILWQIFPFEMFYHFAFFYMPMTILFLEETPVLRAHFVCHRTDSSYHDLAETLPSRPPLSISVLTSNGVCKGIVKVSALNCKWGLCSIIVIPSFTRSSNIKWKESWETTGDFRDLTVGEIESNYYNTLDYNKQFISPLYKTHWPFM